MYFCRLLRYRYRTRSWTKSKRSHTIINGSWSVSLASCRKINKRQFRYCIQCKGLFCTDELQWSMLDLEEVLHTLRVVAVTLSADSFHLFDLARLAGSLDIFEVNLWILAEVHNGTQKVKQTWKTKLCHKNFSQPSIVFFRYTAWLAVCSL